MGSESRLKARLKKCSACGHTRCNHCRAGEIKGGTGFCCRCHQLGFKKKSRKRTKR